MATAGLSGRLAKFQMIYKVLALATAIIAEDDCI